MDSDLRNELDKLWDKLDAIEKRQSSIETRMGIADESRATSARQMTTMGTDIRQINQTLSEIAVSIASARVGIRMAHAIGLAAAGFVGWLAQFLHLAK